MPKFSRVWQHIKGTSKPKRYKRAWKKIVPKIDRKYGINGSIGPAVRFTWEETSCTDGTPVPTKYRKRVVTQARALNKLRKVIAKHHKAKFSEVIISVNSWYRTPAYNKIIGGATKSEHVEARATDIRVYVNNKQVPPHQVAQFALKVSEFNNGGIGWYDESNGNFTHVDHRPDGPARWVNG